MRSSPMTDGSCAGTAPTTRTVPSEKHAARVVHHGLKCQPGFASAKTRGCLTITYTFLLKYALFLAVLKNAVYNGITCRQSPSVTRILTMFTTKPDTKVFRANPLQPTYK